MEFRLLFEEMNRRERDALGAGPSGDDDENAEGRTAGERPLRTAQEIVNMGVNGVPEPAYGQAGEEPAYWERSADLGKLAFLSSWLDMAGF